MSLTARRDGHRCRSTVRAIVLCGVAGAIFFFAAGASASPMGPEDFPGLALRINDHGEGPPEEINPRGIPIAEDRWEYRGSHQPPHGRWLIEWEIDADPDPFLNAVFTLHNLLPTAQNFTLDANLSISPPIIGGSLTGGSFSGTLVDAGGGGAEVRTFLGASAPPMYISRIDGADWQPLMIAPQSFTAAPYGTTGFGPDEFGVPIPSLAGPDVYSTIEIETNARVSGNDVAVFVATFVVVPEPASAGLLVLGAAALLLRRKRR
jgi:hypothetical protein